MPQSKREGDERKRRQCAGDYENRRKIRCQRVFSKGAAQTHMKWDAVADGALQLPAASIDQEVADMGLTPLGLRILTRRNHPLRGNAHNRGGDFRFAVPAALGQLLDDVAVKITR